MSYVTDFTALLHSDPDLFRWNGQTGVGSPVFVTYCFLDQQELPDFETLPPFTEEFPNLYAAMDDVRTAAVRLALAEFEKVCGVKFIEVTSPQDANIKLLQNVSYSVWSWAYSPYVAPDYSGQAFVTMTVEPEIRYDLPEHWRPGGAFFRLTLHEIGHAMGLMHPHEGVLLDPSLDNGDYTIMSYNSGSRPDLAPFDVQALAYLYGPQSGFAADVTWAWDDLTHRFQATGSHRDDTLLALRHDSRLVGGLGDDDLVGFLGDDLLLGQSGHDLLTGGLGDDRLLGGRGRDTLTGGAGDDRILGGQGRDSLQGDEGADHFVFTAADSIGQTLRHRDTITDFTPNLDKIDLGGFMANGVFIGKAQFTQSAGQVRYSETRGTLSGDTNGDGLADWSLTLTNRPALSSADFIF